jgi:tetratricopeptide (TPR) repeat protein
VYGTSFRTVAHEVLAMEATAVPTAREGSNILDEFLDFAVASYDRSRPAIEKLAPRERAIRTLELIERALQHFRFVYPAVGYVGTLRAALLTTSMTDQSLRSLQEEFENRRRVEMISESASAGFHFADCDIFSLLYVAVGELLKLPISMVDLPEPPGGVGHNYVVWLLPNQERVNWEAMSGTERAPERDLQFFFGTPRTLEQAVAAGAFAVPMSRSAILSYWRLTVGYEFERVGAYPQALSNYRGAIELNPASPKGYNEAVWLLTTCPDPVIRQPNEALALGRRLLEIWPSANYIDTVAATYASIGRWKEAESLQRQALEIAQNYDPKSIGFQDRLAMYKNKEAYLAPRAEEHEADNWRERLQNPRWRSLSDSRSLPGGSFRDR